VFVVHICRISTSLKFTPLYFRPDLIISNISCATLTSNSHLYTQLFLFTMSSLTFFINKREQETHLFVFVFIIFIVSLTLTILAIIAGIALISAVLLPLNGVSTVSRGSPIHICLNMSVQVKYYRLNRQ
jgi:hypothetical protein